MARLILIGIDGMDADFVEEHLDEMPNFRALRDRGFGGPARSVFPTDSIPAWITIFTGIPPVEHGFLDAIDYFKKDHKDFAVDLSAFQGRTFWDVASERGKRCCIVNPFMAYPPWDINGIMSSGPVFVDGRKEMVTPTSLEEEIPTPSMGGIVDFPTKETMGTFCQESIDYTLQQHEYSLALLKQKGPFDLFFTTYLTLDRIQHFLWRYHDEGDPTYPGANEFQSVVLDFYKLFDRIVGEYMELAEDDDEILVVSDHGHGRRCTEVVNVNEMLRQQGWLKAKAGGKNPLHPRRLLQQAKRTAMETLDRLDLADMTYKIAKLVPKTRALKKSTFLVDETGQAIYTPYFAGTNPCGGVSVDPERISELGMDYEEARDAVIRLLLDARHPRSGQALFKWVIRREEYLGEGAALDRYPDILFLMESGFGTGWDLFGPVVGVNTTHRKISGGHKVDGVLYTSFGLEKPTGPENRWHLTDIAPMVLRRLDLPVQEWMRPSQRETAAGR